MNLSKGQKDALAIMLRGENIFLTGPAGTGKSEIITQFMKQRPRSKRVHVTSTTGISAIKIKGRTIHSFAGIGTGSADVQRLITHILKERKLKEKWRSVDVLIIDEISMLSAELFDKLEEIAKCIRQSVETFGGIQIILCGDFLQLPNVEGDFCFQAESWNRVVGDNIVELTSIMRQDDILFQKCLNAVRLGEIDEGTKKLFEERIGATLDKNFDGILPTRLFPTNRQVDILNDEELDKLAEDGREFIQYDMEITTYPNVKTQWIDSTIEQFVKRTIFPTSIQLCIGAQVMLLSNIDQDAGLVNGSRGVITEFIEQDPKVRFVNGRELVISKSTIEHEDNHKPILRATQIPLKVAYATTIHKSQGSSLDCVEIDLGEIFECGQAYVALSRARTLKGLVLKSIRFDQIKAHPLALDYYKKIK
tara:strand:+ start:1164 stop:2426 length:1263 start_codon:yes stop_codon:yes gene_type:complete